MEVFLPGSSDVGAAACSFRNLPSSNNVESISNTILYKCP
jgi:hypothetical protein